MKMNYAARNRCERDVVMVVGATGSLGKPIVEEFRRRGVPLRLLGRSRETFEQSGFLTKGSDESAMPKVELIICDLTDHNALQNCWFEDVKLLVCVARPRSLKLNDSMTFAVTIQNLSDMVCRNKVPRMIMLGHPYLEKYLFDKTPTMYQIQRAEDEAKNRFSKQSINSDFSKLTIARTGEMSEMIHLLGFSRAIHVWLCVWGCDPKHQPISAHDFAIAMYDFMEAEDSHISEYLVGGPQVLTWSEIGHSISKALGRRHIVIPLPLCFFSFWIYCFGVGKCIFPFLEGLENILKLVAMPMTSSSRNDDFITVGSDYLDDYLLQLSRTDREQTNYVQKRITLFRQDARSKKDTTKSE
jgi:putative NADH-flavin reductase